MQNRLFITHTGTFITPYTKGQSKKIEQDTSIWNKVYHRHDPVIGFIVNVDENEENMGFVTVKNSDNYLQSLFPNYILTYMDPVKPKKMKHEFTLKNNVTPTDLQANVINEILKKSFQREFFINLQTALGKTLLSVYLSSILRVRTLIMCYSTEILRQWASTIRDKTTFNMSRLLVIDSSRLLHNIYTGKFNTDNYDIFMATPKLIVSFCDKYGFGCLHKTFKEMGIGLKIFDEAHRNMANMVKINAVSSIEKTIYLSADFTQADKEKEKLYYKMMYGVHVITPSEEVMDKLKYTQAIVIEYDSEPTMEESTQIFSSFGFSSTNYMRYQFGKGIIFEVLDFMLQNIFNTNVNNYKILILVTLIEHVDILTDELKERYNDTKIIGRFHSKVDETEKEITRECANIIVSTYQSFGTGVDVSNIKYVISIDQCNKIADNQAAGRARPLPDGSDAFYFMAVDRGFKYCIPKLKSRLNYLKVTKIKNITKIRYYPILKTKNI